MGQQKKASYPTVHTLGWTERQVKDYIREAVSEFSREYEVEISGIAATVELDPRTCPLLNCPLKPQLTLDIVVQDDPNDNKTT